jgi:hypothetical protein
MLAPIERRHQAEPVKLVRHKVDEAMKDVGSLKFAQPCGQASEANFIQPWPDRTASFGAHVHPARGL